MTRAYRLRFYPTPAQERQLVKEFGAARWVWNFALRAMSDAWTERRERLTAVDVGRWLTEVKRDWLPWLGETAGVTATQSLRDLAMAYEAFFSGHARYPRFKRKRNEQSVRYQIREKSEWVAGQRLALTKLGVLNVVWSAVPIGRPKMVTVRRDAAMRWWVCMAVEEDIPALPAAAGVVGVDVGITTAVTLSDGTKVQPPRNLQRRLRTLAHRQRAVSRRVKGSNRRKDAVLRVARVHAKIRDSRRDFLHKVSTQVIRENQAIAIEDLNVRGMVRNRRLSRSLSDAALGELGRMLTYKAQWHGRTLVRVGRYFPSTRLCSACGFTLESLALSERRWTCPECGCEHDRDINAAVNILREGLRKLGEGRPEAMRVEGGTIRRAVGVGARSMKRESRRTVMSDPERHANG